jgi:hypothetical protein
MLWFVARRVQGAVGKQRGEDMAGLLQMAAWHNKVDVGAFYVSPK